MNQYVRVQNGIVTNEYPNGLPASVSWCKDRPYYRATHRHEADGIRPAQFAETPEGMVKTGSSWAEVDGVWVETGTYITPAEKDLQDHEDKWKAENAFLLFINQINAQFQLDLQPSDGYAEVTAKLKASTVGDRQDRTDAALEMMAKWDQCLFHGSSWGNVVYHPEVAE